MREFMRRDWKKLSAISAIAIATFVSGASSLSHYCSPTPQADCNPDHCFCTFCLGPEKVNLPVRPKTCYGDFTITLAGLAWRAEQEGLEYAISNHVTASDAISVNPQLNNLIQAEYLEPHFDWEFGFKLGVGYNTTFDGWDVELLWTHYHTSARGHDEANLDNNRALLPLWSEFQFPRAASAPILFATDVDSKWDLNLNLLDFVLGREFWTSRFLSMRPYIGFRFAQIDQEFHLKYRGGSWNEVMQMPELHLHDFVDLKNNFHGVGMYSGLGTIWNLGCGWGFYGNLALSLIYGRFHLDHNEKIRLATSPFSKTKILETKESFRASRAITDLELGIQWATIFCQRFSFIAQLGWEKHLVLHQNQLWRVARIGGQDESSLLNNTGENVFLQRRGNLSTEGVTLALKFGF